MLREENLSKIAVKGSGFIFASKIISKVFGIIFTVFILARMLGPELFGIYNLALSIVAIALAFTDLGISSAATRFISDSLGKKDKKKARSYFKYFFQLKGLLSASAVVAVIVLSKFLAFNLYDEPILYLSLIFASFHLFISSMSSLPGAVIQATKDFKQVPVLDLIKESSKIILVLPVVFFLTYNLKIPGVFLILGLSSFFMFVYAIGVILKNNKDLIVGRKEKIEKSNVLKYTFFVAISSVSLAIFASFDTLMLGVFVSSEYIGFYRAALSLVLSISALMAVSSVLMPIFTQIKGERLKRGVNRSVKYSLMLAIPASLGLILIAKPSIRIIYGINYMPSVIPLYVLSFAIITSSLISLYSTLLKSREDSTKTLAKLTVLSLGVNIILNYLFISYLVNFGSEFAIFGAGLATVISRGLLAFSLVYAANKRFYSRLPFNIVLKPLIASFLMGLFVWVYKNFISLNLILGIIMILVAMIIYFVTLYLIGGVTKDDIFLLKFIPFINRL